MLSPINHDQQQVKAGRSVNINWKSLFNTCRKDI